MNTKIYYTISEVAQMLDVNTSLLRYWEKEFKELQPSKNSRGQRCYTDKDISLLKKIYYLTHQKGYTLSGAREQLHTADTSTAQQDLARSLQELRLQLLALKEQL